MARCGSSGRLHRTCLVVVAACVSSPAFAQSTGYDYRDGDIRGQIEQAFDRSLSPTPTSGISISGSIGVDLNATDSVPRRSGGKTSDFYTEITPSVFLSAGTRLFHGNLGYNPTIQLYARSGDLNYVEQNFNGSGELVVVPDWLFVSGRAFGGVTSFTGQQQSGSASSGLGGYNRNNTAFNRSIEISPFVRHDFAGYGRLDAAYVGSYTTTGAEAVSGAVAFGSGNQQTGPGNQQILGLRNGSVGLFSNQETLDFSTGSNLGRVSDAVSIRGSQESGGGVSDGATRYSASDTVSYALFKFLSVSVTGGYESISYTNSVPAVRINDLVWGVGAKLVDGAKGTLAVSYGHHDGFDSPSISGAYNLTNRFRVFGSYAEGLSTSLEDFRGQVSGSGVDSFGRSVSLADNAPVRLSNSLFGSDSDVFRSRNLNVGAALLYSRDVFTLSFSQVDGTSVASSTATPGFSQRTRTIQGDWHHDLSERTTLDLGVTYGEAVTSGATRFFSAGTTRSVGVSLTGSYSVSDTVSLRAGYQMNAFDGNGFGSSSGGVYNTGRNVQNVLYVGIRKSFR